MHNDVCGRARTHDHRGGSQVPYPKIGCPFGSMKTYMIRIFKKKIKNS